MNYLIDKKDGPVYIQLYRQIKDDIINGAFSYGNKLPSKRLLAEETGVSTITVEHAYSLLCDEGYAESRQRSGYFVTFRQTDGFASTGRIKNTRKHSRLSTSNCPDFSVSVLTKTMRKVLSDYRDVLLEKTPNFGCVELREAIKQYLARNRGIAVDTRQIVIGSGAEYLYRMIIELLGKDKIYAIEAPSYEKIEQIYYTSGAKYEMLPISENGIESDALSSSSADVLHTTPYESLPSGVTASASKRHEYIRWANTSGRFIIESDYGSEFYVSSQPMETLFAMSKNDNVIYLNTFSRTISPSMRVGYMVLPKKLVQKFEDKLGFYSCTVPTYEQYVLAELINNGDFERHINRVRRSKRKEFSGK